MSLSHDRAARPRLLRRLSRTAGVVLAGLVLATAVVAGVPTAGAALTGTDATAQAAGTTSPTTGTSPASSAGTGNTGGTNAAVATNTHDGKAVYAIQLKIVQTGADVVDPVNAAVAVASCSDCQTVAIALDGVLVYGDPSVFAPENLAAAINVDCSNCQTLATAYQDVVQRSTRVRITAEGRQRIAEIRRDLESLRNSGLDIFAVQQRVDTDAAAFYDVLLNDCVPVGDYHDQLSAAPSPAAESPEATSSPTSSVTPSAASSAQPSTTAGATSPAPETSTSPATTATPSPSTSTTP